MNNNFTKFGDKVIVRKGVENDYFPYYIERYQGGICTLMCGLNSELEVIAKMADLLEGK